MSSLDCCPVSWAIWPRIRTNASGREQHLEN
jgi:hypothetical protein